MVAVMNSDGSVAERVWYTPYGEARHFWGDDANGDFQTDTQDAIDIYALGLSVGPDIADDQYIVEMDLDRDGDVDLNDMAQVGSAKSALPAGWISDAGSTSLDNIVGYDGYLFIAASEQYHVRYRCYDPELGRWLERDPRGYFDGLNLFAYVRSLPLKLNDPLGLQSQDPMRIHGIDGSVEDCIRHYLAERDRARTKIKNIIQAMNMRCQSGGASGNGPFGGYGKLVGMTAVEMGVHGGTQFLIWDSCAGAGQGIPAHELAIIENRIGLAKGLAKIATKGVLGVTVTCELYGILRELEAGQPEQAVGRAADAYAGMLAGILGGAAAGAQWGTCTGGFIGAGVGLVVGGSSVAARRAVDRTVNGPLYDTMTIEDQLHCIYLEKSLQQQVRQLVDSIRDLQLCSPCEPIECSLTK
ncbi:MAG: RHS repeat-associated core domain-containing protein [Phycisphaerales bacterium JB038]